MARMYNCGICGGKHEINTECPHKYKFKKVSDVSQKANKFYRTKAWQMKRKEIIERDKYCQRCWLKFGIVNMDQLQIHHIKQLTQYWEERLNNDNLICVCLQCHRFLDQSNNGKLDFDWLPPEIKEDDFEFR